MTAPIRTRIERLEAAREARTKARECQRPERLWVALNLAVRAMAGHDVTLWRAALADLPPLPPGPVRRPWSNTERTMRVLGLLLREARERSEYREILGCAVGAGLIPQEWTENPPAD